MFDPVYWERDYILKNTHGDIVDERGGGVSTRGKAV